jgi:hypothetical protein
MQSLSHRKLKAPLLKQGHAHLIQVFGQDLSQVQRTTRSDSTKLFSVMLEPHFCEQHRNVPERAAAINLRTGYFLTTFPI